MTRRVLLGVLLVLAGVPAFSQTLMDYVSAVRGDTLVIKTQDDMLGDANALYQALLLDSTNVPADRVYLLKAGGIYPLQNNPTSSANRSTVIIGSDFTPVVNNKNATSFPPLICGNVGTTTNLAGITAGGNLTVKNVALTPAASDGTENWAFTGSGAANIRIEYNNCIFERTRWIEVAAFNDGVSYFLKNCYFVNLNGQPCRRNGGVYDGFNKLDTFLVENTTHINAQGSMYKWRNYPANRIIINHNTFVNCAGYVFMDNGYQSNASYTNNIFVNSNIQSYPGIKTIDNGEQDMDWLPMGLVDVYPDSALEANHTPRKFLVEGNVAYWDPSLNDMETTLNTNRVNGVNTWVSQMITMNSRTQAMFNDNAKYPYLTEGVWYTEKPNFTDPKNLYTTALADLKAYALAVADTNSTAVLPDWRLVSTGPANYVYYDWPIPVDLSYNNPTLLTGATNGFPVGDLNWFPAQKVQWNAQRAAEYAKIQTALDNGTKTVGIATVNTLPNEFALSQNYPNPFNPSTTISFVLPRSGMTTLKVYDVLGNEVTTLVNGFTSQGQHEVTFNAGNLASGFYVYKLTSGSLTEVRKMMLLK